MKYSKALTSNCCDYPPTFEINENHGLFGHCSKCGEHAEFIEEEEE